MHQYRLNGMIRQFEVFLSPEASVIVPDFTISMYCSSCIISLSASLRLFAFSFYIFIGIPKAGWDERKQEKKKEKSRRLMQKI